MKGDRGNIDSRQYPDWAEFTPLSESETAVAPKDGFVFALGTAGATSAWRTRSSGSILYIEYWNGTSWTEQGRFEA